MVVPQFLTVTASQRCGCPDPTRILDLSPFYIAPRQGLDELLAHCTLCDTGLLAFYIHVFVGIVHIVVQRRVLPTATKS